MILARITARLKKRAGNRSRNGTGSRSEVFKSFDQNIYRGAIMARKSIVEEPPRPSVEEIPPQAALKPVYREPKRSGSLADLLSAMAVTWRGNAPGGVVVYNDLMPHLARAMTGFAGGVSGGFLIPPQWADGLWEKARNIDGPFARCRLFRTLRREFYLPGYTETSRADGARWGGVFGRWRGSGSAEIEALEGIASQPTAGQIQFECKRLMVYTAPISRDLAADAELLDSLLDLAVFSEFRYQINASMFTGNGENAPQGIIGSPATIVVAKDGGQAAGSISAKNIDNMWQALYGPCKQNAIWSANDDTMAIIDQIATANNWPQSIYLPQAVNGNQHPLIKGRPLVPAEQLPAAGTPGDLVLCDWSQYGFCYLTMRPKDGTVEDRDAGIRVEVGLPDDLIESSRSMHLLFDTDGIAYKWKLRADGKLLWGKPLLNANGFTVGPACIIAQR
jgi:HK97 family phage major capsid protein